MYIRKVNDEGGPLKTLRSFQRVKLAGGQTRQVTISLPATAFEFFDGAVGKMMVTLGDYEILYGNSAGATDLKMMKITIGK